MTDTKQDGRKTSWTPERRAAAAERCRAYKPWEQSTGPKTVEGKMFASFNALKHGRRRSNMKHARKMLRLNREFFENYKAFHTIDIIRMSLSNELIKMKAEYGYNPLERQDFVNKQGEPPMKKHERTDKSMISKNHPLASWHLGGKTISWHLGGKTMM